MRRTTSTRAAQLTATSTVEWRLSVIGAVRGVSIGGVGCGVGITGLRWLMWRSAAKVIWTVLGDDKIEQL